MYELKHISPWATAKFAGLIGGIFLLIPTVIGMLWYVAFESYSGYSDELWLLLFWLFFPLIGGVIYFLLAALIVWIYNMLNKRIGGIELELEYIEDNKKA